MLVPLIRYETNMSQRRDNIGNMFILFNINTFSVNKYTHPINENTASEGYEVIVVWDIAGALTIRITTSYPDFRPLQEIHRILTDVSQ